MRGRRFASIILAFGIAVLIGGLALRRAMPTSDQAAPTISIGGPFTLTDGDGKTVTDRDFRGKWMLVYFGYTHCPDACPTALAAIAASFGKLGAKAAQIVPLFVTVDPDRDNPAVMRDYVKSFGPQFVGLTGSSEQLKKVEHAYRVYAAKQPEKNGDYEMDHSSIIYVMNPDGRFVGDFTGDSSPEKIAARMEKLMR